ncbi:hypothetical protein HBI43_181210 [Parastagonospora nodorum]|nr:hypothetical protein HBI43_181210 [Parastagonospora nodorum]
MHLRISAQKNGLPVYNDRVRIDSRIIACRTQGERPGWRYVLPIHHYQLPRRDVGSLAIELRKVGEDQYLRKDPSKLIDITGLTYLDCHGTYQLFFDPPVVHGFRVRHDVPPSYNGKEYIRKLRCSTMRFIFGPNVQPMDCYPESRYDHKDSLFFTTVEYDCSDWGILEGQAIFESNLSPASGPLAINYTVCTTSWGANAVWPSCSLLPPDHTLLHGTESLKSEISGRNVENEGLLRILVRNSVPRNYQSNVHVPGTNQIAVMVFTCDRSRDSSQHGTWEMHVRCSLYERGKEPQLPEASSWDN